MKNKLAEIAVCPGTLKEGYSTYCPAVYRNLFNGRKVSHILNYMSPVREEDAELFLDNRRRISISGVQEKMSMVLDGNVLRLTREGEQGAYILKPVPRDLKHVDQVPANEHLTMQIARQIFDLNVAENALIFFRDGTPAYLTKRFDIRSDGLKWGKEDFASLAGKTEKIAGQDYKYHFSYTEMSDLIKKYVPTWRVEMEKFFRVVVFNYLFSNGDAHLKNFALLETPDSDYTLSPFYDLINTRMHVDDTPFALDGGLFDRELRTNEYRRMGYPTGRDFRELAKVIGIPARRTDKLFVPFLEKSDEIEAMIERSFLSQSAKRGYAIDYMTRRNKLR
jgi:serine/threonine-protein kinase HipA